MEITSTAKISIETLNDMIANNLDKKITIKDNETYPISKGREYDFFTFLTIKRAINEFLKGCPSRNPTDPDSEKKIFTYIYIKLAYYAKFDKFAKEIGASSEEFKAIYDVYDYLNKASGLDGVFISQEALPSGFVEALRNLLAEKGIKSKFILGIVDKNNSGDATPYAWNQVKLDGEWYNCDIVGDRAFILQGLNLPGFLKSTYDFSNILHRYTYDHGVKSERCRVSLSQQEQDSLISHYQSVVEQEYAEKNNIQTPRKESFIDKILKKLKIGISQKGEWFYE